MGLCGINGWHKNLRELDFSLRNPFFCLDNLPLAADLLHIQIIVVKGVLGIRIGQDGVFYSFENSL